MCCLSYINDWSWPSWIDPVLIVDCVDCYRLLIVIDCGLMYGVDVVDEVDVDRLVLRLISGGKVLIEILKLRLLM